MHISVYMNQQVQYDDVKITRNKSGECVVKIWRIDFLSS